MEGKVNVAANPEPAAGTPRRLRCPPRTLVYPAAMRRLRAWFTRVTAFRIGLLTGLAFSAVHVLQLAGRMDVPLLTRLEGALIDLRFAQRVALRGSGHSGQVVVAAVDEAAIARFGRFP